MVYCNKLSDISKNTLKNIVGNLQHCSCCINCCKKAFLQHSLELLDIVDFRFENPEKYIDEQKVGVIIPDYLSANSFLQPPIDMLNMIKLFKMHGINYMFIDNRVKHLSFLQIGNMIKEVTVGSNLEKMCQMSHMHGSNLFRCRSFFQKRIDRFLMQA